MEYSAGGKGMYRSIAFPHFGGLFKRSWAHSEFLIALSSNDMRLCGDCLLLLVAYKGPRIFMSATVF
jgi:hypothetical protein